LLIAFCLFVAVPFYLILNSNDGQFKRWFFPLFVKAVLGIVVFIFLAYAWKEHRLSFGFVFVVIFIAAGVLFSILFRYEFCRRCGATNTYYFLRQDRTYCQKCGKPFESGG
jgi:ribosomal protein L40E